jgi:hypothetical protein
MYWKTEKEKMEDLRKFLEELQEKKDLERIEREKREAAREKKKHPHLKEAKIIGYINEPPVKRRDFMRDYIGVVLKHEVNSDIDKVTNSDIISVAKKESRDEPEEHYVKRNGMFVKASEPEEHYVKRNGMFVKVSDSKK